MFIGILIIFISSCNRTNLCDIGIQEADFILMNIIDEETGEDILFGNQKQIDFSQVNVQALATHGGDYIEAYYDDVLNVRDSVLLIGFTELSITFPLPLQHEFIINYNQEFPADTLKIQYAVAGYCDDSPMRFDYNVILNNEILCTSCFREVIDIKK